MSAMASQFAYNVTDLQHPFQVTNKENNRARNSGPLSRRISEVDSISMSWRRMPGKVWDDISCPFLNFNGCTVEV